jgi:hypothetical protein
MSPGDLGDAPVIVEGDEVHRIGATNRALMAATIHGEALDPTPKLRKFWWPLRTNLSNRLYFGQTPEARGLRWFDHAMFFPKRHESPLSISYPTVATHNHFVLDHGGRVFKDSAPPEASLTSLPST